MQRFDMSSSSLQLYSVLQPWKLYGIGIVVIILRIFARWYHTRSLRRFAADDWIMMTAAPVFYTGLVACSNALATIGRSETFPAEDLATFTQDKIDGQIKRRMVVVVAEQCMLNLMSSLRICVLLMFARTLTKTTAVKWIKGITAYVVSGWLAIQIAFFAGCYNLEQFAFVQAIFNLSSDVPIIAIASALIMSLSLPPKQKIGLVVTFSMCTFVVLAAVPPILYDLSDIYSLTRILKYTHEASFAVYVANIPDIWCLVCEKLRPMYDTAQSNVRGYSAQQYRKVCTGESSHHRYMHVSHNAEPEDLECREASHNDQGGRTIDLGGANPWKCITVDVHVDIKVEILDARHTGPPMEFGQSRIVTCEGPNVRADSA